MVIFNTDNFTYREINGYTITRELNPHRPSYVRSKYWFVLTGPTNIIQHYYYFNHAFRAAIEKRQDIAGVAILDNRKVLLGDYA